MLLTVLVSTAQEIYVETGKTLSTFDYSDSQGNKLDNLQAFSYSFLELGYSHKLFIKNMNISLGVAYAGYGAIGSENNLGNYMKWDLNYVEFIAGLDYRVFLSKNFGFFVKGKIASGILLQGSQTLNNTVYDLVESEAFENTMVHYKYGGGLLYKVSEKLSVTAQYMKGESLNLGTSQESLLLKSDHVSLGFLINLRKKTTPVETEKDVKDIKEKYKL